MFKGSIVALITPFNNDELDEENYTNLIHYHLKNGTHGVVPGGTTGESPTLSHNEHKRIIEISVKETKGKIPVIAGTGSNSTSEAIELSKYAEKAGADGLLIVTPYYNKPTQEGLFLHHKAIAEAVDIPQILYNVPGRTVCDMLPKTVARLSNITNIIGIKEATGDVARVAEIRNLCGPEFLLFSGDDATACEFMLGGGNGVISVTANVAPSKMRAMCLAALNGDRASAKDIDLDLQDLHRDLFIEANPIPVKWVLREMGLLVAGIRLPLTWLSPDKENIVKEAMSHSDL